MDWNKTLSTHSCHWLPHGLGLFLHKYSCATTSMSVAAHNMHGKPLLLCEQRKHEGSYGGDCPSAPRNGGSIACCLGRLPVPCAPVFTPLARPPLLLRWLVFPEPGAGPSPSLSRAGESRFAPPLPPADGGLRCAPWSSPAPLLLSLSALGSHNAILSMMALPFTQKESLHGTATACTWGLHGSQIFDQCCYRGMACKRRHGTQQRDVFLLKTSDEHTICDTNTSHSRSERERGTRRSYPCHQRTLESIQTGCCLYIYTYIFSTCVTKRRTERKHNATRVQQQEPQKAQNEAKTNPATQGTA